MPLIPCPDCGKECSDQARVCVNCGHPLLHKTAFAKFTGGGGVMGVLILLVFILMLVVVVLGFLLHVYPGQK
jgi:hypothetical protein